MYRREALHAGRIHTLFRIPKKESNTMNIEHYFSIQYIRLQKQKIKQNRRDFCPLFKQNILLFAVNI